MDGQTNRQTNNWINSQPTFDGQIRAAGLAAAFVCCTAGVLIGIFTVDIADDQAEDVAACRHHILAAVEELAVTLIPRDVRLGEPVEFALKCRGLVLGGEDITERTDEFRTLRGIRVLDFDYL